MSTAAKYRKKPVEIEAVQWDGGAQNATPIIDWILSSGHTARWDEAHEAWESEDGKQGYAAEPEHLAIHTLEGTMRADPGDWIIRGTEGEFYPVKPAAFAATFEPVRPAVSDTETRDPLVEPTPAQWVDEFLALDSLTQEYWADRILKDTRTAFRCFMRGHDDAVRRLTAAQTELSRLRGVVEAVRAVRAKLPRGLPDGIEDDYERGYAHASDDVARRLDVALASVSSSGEAESGDCTSCGLADETCSRVCAAGGIPCCDVCRATGGCSHAAPSSSGEEQRCPKCGCLYGSHGLVHIRHGNGGGHNEPCPLTPAPVVSGGQADGTFEAQTDAGGTVYEWVEDSQADGEGEGLTQDERDWLSDVWDEETTVSVSAFFPVIDRIIAARLAARPVLSREAVADLLLAHGGEWNNITGHIECDCGWSGPMGSGAHAYHLADVLAAAVLVGQER